MCVYWMRKGVCVCVCVCAWRNIRPLQMCAAWTSALLPAIVKEAVKMVGSSAQQSSLVRKLPLNCSSHKCSRAVVITLSSVPFFLSHEQVHSQSLLSSLGQSVLRSYPTNLPYISWDSAFLLHDTTLFPPLTFPRCEAVLSFRNGELSYFSREEIEQTQLVDPVKSLPSAILSCVAEQHPITQGNWTSLRGPLLAPCNIYYHPSSRDSRCMGE